MKHILTYNVMEIFQTFLRLERSEKQIELTLEILENFLNFFYRIEGYDNQFINALFDNSIVECIEDL